MYTASGEPQADSPSSPAGHDAESAQRLPLAFTVPVADVPLPSPLTRHYIAAAAARAMWRHSLYARVARGRAREALRVQCCCNRSSCMSHSSTYVAKSHGMPRAYNSTRPVDAATSGDLWAPLRASCSTRSNPVPSTQAWPATAAHARSLAWAHEACSGTTHQATRLATSPIRRRVLASTKPVHAPEHERH